MLTTQPAKLLRLHFCEGDRYRDQPLYEAVVQKCRDLNISGVTVFRGFEGYGESAEIHRSHLFTSDQPIVVTIVETPENVDRLLPEVEEMLDTGMIAISTVEMIRVRNGNVSNPVSDQA